ncbi:NDP-hexose 2,3-dehydratase family protein [Acidimicrobiia bacterium]|jgi:oxidase EvaA|nr:NDP-hexose 2,3-dehydratase family protein [Acidimicrobiia bacterium]
MINYKNILSSIENIDSPLGSYDSIQDAFLKSNKKKFIVREIGISNLEDWSFDAQENLVHKSNAFFKLTGINNNESNSGILLQGDIGTLGILCCFYEDILHFLIQFKQEPGNILQSQLSPTLQATLSNQNKKHGGKAPKYMEYFQTGNKENLVIQKNLPEQGSRYWKKYNNNIVVLTDFFEPDKNFKWMTLGQIFKFSEIDSSINSCLRSVLSLIYSPLSNLSTVEIDNKITDFKNKIKNTAQLQNSVINFYNKEEDKFIFPHKKNPFHVVGVSIEIRDREVSNWNQPLIVEANLSDYALISLVFKNERYYLLNIEEQPGYEFGFVFGVTAINSDFSLELNDQLNLDQLKLVKKINMSEEGGRFLHTAVNKSFYELKIDDLNFHFKNFLLVNDDEINRINLLGLLSMELRSMLFFSKYVYRNLKS